MKIFFATMSLKLKNPNAKWIIDKIYVNIEKNIKKYSITYDPDEADIVIYDLSTKCDNIYCDKNYVFKKKTYNILFIHHIEMNIKGKWNHYQNLINKINCINYLTNKDEGTVKIVKECKKKYPDIKIIRQPFAVENIYKSFTKVEKKELRKKYDIPEDSYVLGSFIRNCEKPIKNIELFMEIVLYFKNYKKKNVFVIITGQEREKFLIFCIKNKIPHFYKNPEKSEIMNEYYGCLDLYVITSLTEGAPMQLYECALTKTPLVSTDVGNVSLILPPDGIMKKPTLDEFINAKKNMDVEYCYRKVQNFILRDGYYDNFFDNCVKKNI